MPIWLYMSHLAMFLELNLHSSFKTCFANMPALTFSLCVKRYPSFLRYSLFLIRIIAFSLYCAYLKTLLNQVHFISAVLITYLHSI